jgi:hypothetical protein
MLAPLFFIMSLYAAQGQDLADIGSNAGVADLFPPVCVEKSLPCAGKAADLLLDLRKTLSQIQQFFSLSTGSKPRRVIFCRFSFG